MNFKQTALGFFNKQKTLVYNNRLTVDFLPREIESLLDSIISTDGDSYLSEKIIPPDLPKKNEINNIDDAYFKLIESDFIHFDSIEKVIQKDSTNGLVKKYLRAKKILQHQYLGEFAPDFPAFVNAIIRFVNVTPDASNIDELKVTIFLHYLYSECEVGKIP